MVERKHASWDGSTDIFVIGSDGSRILAALRAQQDVEETLILETSPERSSTWRRPG